MPNWQPQRAIAVLALMVGLLLSALVANDLYRDYQHEYDNASAKTASLTQLLEEHARQSLRRVELALDLAAKEVQARTNGIDPVSPRLSESLRAYLPQDNLIGSFSVLDAQGHIVASTGLPEGGVAATASTRDVFKQHVSDREQKLFVGATLKDLNADRLIIPVSIRLQGNFNGHLVATVDPEYFQRLYQSIEPGGKGFVTLFSKEGWALARWPFSADIAARNWLGSPLFKLHLPQRPAGTVRQVLAFNGVESVYSYRALPEYPVVVALGMQLDESMRDWRRRAIYEVSGLVAVLLILALFAWLLVAQLRKRLSAESALKLSETSVLKSSLPTVWIGPDARVLRANQAACDLHRYTEERMRGLTVFDLNPRMPPQKWPAHWERLKQERSVRFETHHRTGDGVDVPVEVELNFIEFDGQEYNFAFIRDLTLRKQSEDAMQRSAATLRGAIDAVDEAFVLFDANDALVYCNEKYLQLYPALRDAIVPGVRFEDMIRTGAQRGLFQDAIGREEEWVTERLRAHTEGEEMRIQKRADGRVLRVIDRRTPDGSIVGIRVDITEMVRATEEAQEASRYKSQFLANMSHEIRTPMNAILGLLTLLQKTELNAVQRDYTGKTHGAAQSLLGLLNDILDFSKVEAGKMELDPQPFRHSQLLADLSVILVSSIGNKAIDVLFDIDRDVPEDLFADAMRLQQVLVNLAGNAIKFTETGQVVLRVSTVPAPVGHARSEPWVHYAIEDSGIGIPLDKQAHIFSGFSQAEASTTRRFGGTGLGLAICKRLVELMGGTLSLESAPGKGSTFRFALPLLRPAATGDSQESAAPVPALQVLVVDDNPVALEILCKTLRSFGWTVESANSAQRALEVVRGRMAAAQPALDVIYLDWQMPGQDGWETARQLHQIDQHGAARPRIVMLSANGRDTLNVRTEEEQSMVAGLLQKPATPAALRDAAVGPRHPPAAPGKAQRSSNRPLAGMRILVVEDNLINQQVAEELLTAEGALVSLAANGQLGVDAVQASQPAFDVVLMDLQMPVLDGYGATRKIREELGLRDLPIVAMTANALASDRSACLAAGMNEHVGKPFELSHLVSVLLRVSGRSQPADKGAMDVAPVPAVGGVPGTGKEAATLDPYIDVHAALARLSGMKSLYVRITQEFIASLHELEAPFRNAAARGDFAALTAQMHSLKGTAATLGAMPLSARAALMEKLFRAPAADLAPLEHLPALLELAHATQAAAGTALEALAAKEAPLPDLDQPPEKPLQRQAAIDLLRSLAHLLRQSDLGVLGRFDQRGNTLNQMDPVRRKALEDALQSLNFQSALQLCEEGIAALVSQEAPD